MKKIILLAFVLVLLSTAVFVGFIRSAVAEETIYIRADGSVEGTTDISTVDNVTYTFTDNIFNQSIVVERDNIVVDGAGYTLQGTGSSEGIGTNLTERSNVTIKNMTIKAFHSGIHLSESYENTISENNITNIHFGIWLRYSSNFNNISGNNILNSKQHNKQRKGHLPLWSIKQQHNIWKQHDGEQFSEHLASRSFKHHHNWKQHNKQLVWHDPRLFKQCSQE